MTDAPVRLRPGIAGATPYRAGRPAPGDAFKLSSNENPFDPLPSVLAALEREQGLNRYPDAAARRLREALAARHGVDVEAVHAGAGSVSLLAQFILAASGPDDEVVFAWRSFEAYPGLVMVSGATAVTVPVDASGRHDTVAMAAAVTERTRLVIVCSPNNPTGTTVTQSEFDALVAAVPGDVLVLLDEAYAEFVTASEAVRGRPADLPPNVVVLRTFSKAYGLAGLRVGYAIGDPRVLDAARITAIPFSVTEQAETAAIASLAAEDELAARVADLVARRERLVAGLRDAGWPVPEAQGNFVWLPTGERTAEIAAVFDAAGLIVRPLGEGIRISVGEADSVEKVVRVAASVVEHLPERVEARG